MDIIEQFPKAWRCDVTVHRSGGRNADGDPTPGSDHVIQDCLVGRRATEEPVDHSDLTDTLAVMYGPVGADVTSTDQITVPSGHFMAGTYSVAGDPGFWPMGTEVPLRKV